MKYFAIWSVLEPRAFAMPVDNEDLTQVFKDLRAGHERFSGPFDSEADAERAAREFLLTAQRRKRLRLKRQALRAAEPSL